MDKHASTSATSQKDKPRYRIAHYIRVSTEEQAENPEGSIRNQKDRLNSALNLRNLDGKFGEVVGVYVDVLSGKDTNRPELQKMLAAIRRREINLIMVTELSRLSRNTRDFAEMWEMLRQHGCSFQSLRENFDTVTAAGEMMIYTMMNLAQFERRQIAERVSANIVARAKRGLYNGGPVPLGYQLIPEKHGYLAVDEEQAKIVREAFQTFLKEQSISTTAKILNAKGIRYKRQMQGGGHSPRLGHFTATNLYCVLKNKAYIGVKAFQVGGEIREAKAVWEPIVDEDVFSRTQEIMAKNYRRQKRSLTNRYPFLLAGISYCGQCGERLSGKSANGRAGKIPYYEHAWTTKRQSCLSEAEKTFHCTHRRILAKRVEPAVWEEVQKLLQDPQVAETLLNDARAIHENRTKKGDSERIQGRIYNLNSQIEALAERIAALPKTLSADPFYRQMEKLQATQADEQAKLKALEAETHATDEPAQLASMQEFLAGLRKLADGPKGEELRAQIVQMLIQKIEILPTAFRLHYLIGRNYMERELASAGSLFLSLIRENAAKTQLKGVSQERGGGEAFTNPPRVSTILNDCSNSTCNGVPEWSRTTDLQLRRLTLYPTELRAQRGLDDSILT